MKTADLYDAHGDDLQVADPIFRDFGGWPAFSGPIVTLKVYEDNSRVRTALEEQGEGRVLVVDGAGSTRRALLGDRLASLAAANGWSGVVIYGAIRDVEEIEKLPIGVKALATTPRKTEKRNTGERDRVVHFAGVTFTPGHHLYADRDGVVVAPNAL